VYNLTPVSGHLGDMELVVKPTWLRCGDFWGKTCRKPNKSQEDYKK
jgi:hypothetical protein